MELHSLWLRVISVVCIINFCPWVCFSSPIDSTRARRVAEVILSDKDLVFLPPSVETEELFIVCRKNHDGFVIVSGDDRLSPICGYSETGSFDPNNIPDNLRYWLNGYKEESRRVKIIQNNASEKVRAQWKNLENGNNMLFSSATGVLLETANWDQGDPFNRLCPEVNGTRSVTGCVATAMAIVMRYHKWPIAGHGTIPDYSYNLGTKVIRITGYTLGKEYLWDDMLLTSYSPETFTQRQGDAVAELMRDCGYIVQMQYSPSSSGAYSDDIWPAMEQYMSYTDGQYIQRRLMSATEWDQLLRQSLDGAIPIIYTAVSPSGGHAFVVDGYDDNGYYHINWGWGGNSNGYFRCPDFADFTQQHCAIINAIPHKPASVLLTLIPYEGETGLWCSQESFKKGDCFDVGYAVKNTSQSTTNATLSIGIFNRDNVLVDIASGEDEIVLQAEESFYGKTTCTLREAPQTGTRIMLCSFADNGWIPIYSQPDSGISSYILLADEYTLEDSTSAIYNIVDEELKIITKPDVNYDFHSSDGKVLMSGTVGDEGAIYLSVKSFEKGSYVLVLSKDNEIKSIRVVL